MKTMKIRSSILILIWRKKFSLFFIVGIFLIGILITLWSGTIYSATTREKLIFVKDYNPDIKHEYFLQRLISQANQILKYQRKQHIDAALSSKTVVRKQPKIVPAMENNPFEEERLKVLQSQQKGFGQKDEGSMDYERILSSAERQLQYEHQLHRMGVPVVSGIGPGGTGRPPHERIVHLDLKGAPPKLSFLKRLIPIIKTLGATGILIEYEDMFPYSGVLESLAAKNAYKPEELKEFLETAALHQLYIIPLVQTFGHLEFALKLQGFEGLREIPESPQSICPSKSESLSFLQEMLSQVIEFHSEVLNKNLAKSVDVDDNTVGGASSARRRKIISQNFTHIHIGCDEVRMWECSKCRLKGRNELFLSHAVTLANYIKTKWPNLKTIIWDDMLREMTLSELQHSQIGSYVEPMVWVYATDIYHFIQPTLWDIYAKVFSTAWAASAFKGAFGERIIIPPIQRHLENNIRWLAVIDKEGGRFSKGFSGIALTGWQRYDHFATLCELLPTGIPSLITSLSTVSKGYFSTDPKDNDILKVMECTNRPDYRRSGHQWLELQTNTRSNQGHLFSLCSYPGSSAYKFILKLSEKLNEIEIYLVNVKGKSAWMSDYNVKHNFSSPLRIRDLTVNTQNYIDELTSMSKECHSVMFEIFDEYTIIEFIEQNIYPAVKELYQHIENGKKMFNTRTWQRRPLPYEEELLALDLINNQSEKKNENI